MHKQLLTPLLTACTLLTACGNDGLDPRLAPLSNAPLEVGRGLGDLVLGETTLEQVVERYGPGRVALFAGDEAGFEIALGGGQLDLLFQVPTAWYQSGAPLQEAVRDLPGVLVRNPEYGELPLVSLAVSISKYGRDSLYLGSLARGGRLNGPIDDVLRAYGLPPGGPGAFVAGMSPSNPEERALYPDLGLMVHYRTPEQEEDEEPEPALIEMITLFGTGAS